MPLRFHFLPYRSVVASGSAIVSLMQSGFALLRTLNERAPQSKSQSLFGSGFNPERIIIPFVFFIFIANDRIKFLVTIQVDQCR